ncbi:MAG: glycosyltransferase [Polyangiales bacterium]
MLLPTRDNADTILDAVGDILAERDVALELVVVDDGSRDETPTRLASVGDPRMRVLRTEGWASSRR